MLPISNWHGRSCPMTKLTPTMERVLAKGVGVHCGRRR